VGSIEGIGVCVGSNGFAIETSVALGVGVISIITSLMPPFWELLNIPGNVINKPTIATIPTIPTTASVGLPLIMFCITLTEPLIVPSFLQDILSAVSLFSGS
jgi:hypothetical protein